MSVRWLALTAVVLVAACHTVTSVGPLTPSQELKGYPPKIEITHHDYSRETVYSPSVVGDSLIGYKKMQGSNDSVRVAYPLSDIRDAEEREFSGTRTVGAIAAFTLAAGIVLFVTAAIAISHSTSHKS